MSAPVAAEVVQRRRMRRTTEQILGSAVRRIALVMEDLTFAAGPMRKKWRADGQRAKVWKDANKKVSEMPAWISAMKMFGGAMVRAETEKPSRPPLNLHIHLGGRIPRGDWEKKAAALQEKDQEERKQLEAKYAAEDAATGNDGGPTAQ